MFEFNRVPFGLKGSGNSFVRAITKILYPIREFADSFVDDVAVHSDQWKQHLIHIDKFLQTVKNAGLTLNLKKSKWAQSQVKLCGQIIGSGKRLADPDKIKVVEKMNVTRTKTQLRQVLGLFSYFRERIKDFAGVVKSLTDLMFKCIKIPWNVLP